MRNFPLVLLFACFAFLSSCHRTEIAQWRGSNRDGIYPENNLLAQWPAGGPKLLWKFDSLGFGYSSAVVTSNRVFTAGTIDSITYMFSFDLKGRLLWKSKLGKDWMINWAGIRSTPTIYGDFGYILNGLGVLYCFKTKNGDVVWTKDIVKDFNAKYLEFGVCENLVVDDEKLYLTTAGPDADVVALDRKTGSIIWKSKSSNDAKSYAAPIVINVGEKKLYVALTHKSVFALNTQNGELAWRYSLDSTNNHECSPIYRDGFMLVLDGWKGGSFMLKLSDNGDSITEVWRNPDLRISMGDAILIGDRIFGYEYKKRAFSCLDWNSGKELYSDSIKTESVILISAMDLLYCYDNDANFSLIKPLDNSFKKLGSIKISGGRKQHCSPPVIKDGRLYIRHDNSLFVYNISTIN